MKKIIQYFIDNSFVVNLISILLLVVGAMNLMTMKRDLVPQWQSKYVDISASLNGATPRQIERFMVNPIENALKAFPEIEKMQSTSSESSMSINLTAKSHLSKAEVKEFADKVESTVNALKNDLPRDMEDLRVINYKSTRFWFATVGLLNFDREKIEHRLWEQRVKKELTNIPGIITIEGRSSLPSIYIKFKNEQIARYQVTSQEILKKLDNSLRPFPIGSLKRDEESITLQFKEKRFNKDFAEDLIIKANSSGRAIRLKDVASISVTHPKATRMSLTNKVPSLDMYVMKDLDSDSLDLKPIFERTIKKLNESSPKGVSILMTENGPEFIQRQLNVLNTNAFMGIILVIITLALFLGLKSSLMTSLGLPLAYSATFIALNFLEIKIDLISLVGMILILGILVDDAIIVAEQYSQYLESGYRPREAATKAVQTTIVPVTGTIITTIVAFAPILLSDDGLSSFLKAIPWVVFAALAMSWFESFFILPNHLAHFVKKPLKVKEYGLFSRVKNFYRRSLNVNLKWRYPLILCLITFMGYSLYFAKKNVPMKYNLRIGSEKIRVIAELKKSKDLEDSQKQLKPVWDIIDKISPDRYSYLSAKIGHAYINGKSKTGVEFARIEVRFTQTHPNIEDDKKYILEFIKKELKSVNRDGFKSLLVEKKKSGHEKAQDHTISVKIKGESGESSEKILNDLRKSSKNLKETKEAFLSESNMRETWVFDVDSKKLSEYNISQSNIAFQIKQLTRLNYLREVDLGEEKLPLYSYSYSNHDDIKLIPLEQLRELPILVGNGQSAPLHSFGKWIKTKTLKSITHVNKEREIYLDLSYDDKLIKKEAYQEKVDSLVKPFKAMYPKLKFIVKDADEEAAKNKKSMNTKFIYCIGLILFVLALVLKSTIQPLLIGMAIPFGIIGVIWAFYFHGQAIDVMAIVGVIGMAGVVVNDSLLMVDTINRKRENKRVSRINIIEGATSRLRAILLTSITTLGGVFPMAYGIGGDSGFTKPLALSLGWGLLFATLLTIFVIPVLIQIQEDIIIFTKRLIKKVFKQCNIEEDLIVPTGEKKEQSDDDSVLH